jgi:hypothetical protein
LVNPYIEDKDIRIFSCQTEQSELVWHRDKKDRTVMILEGEGWMFQRDNELPMTLSEGDEIEISAFEYHRIIKGKTDLKIKIKEHGNV